MEDSRIIARSPGSARGILSALLAIILSVFAQPQATAEGSGPDLSGVWQVRVEGLSIWAPRYTLPKAVGKIHWKLSVFDGELSLREYDSDAEIPGNRPADDPFEEVDVREVIVRNDLVAFKVAGVSGAYEAYWLELFSKDEIIGTYIVYDRFGGGPGSGPEYRARLVLKECATD